MTIDFSRFVKKETVIFPIVDGWGSIHGRKFYFNKKGSTHGTHLERENGWYELEISDYPRIIKKASPLQIRKALIDKKSFLFYVLGNEGIPLGKTISVPIHFMNARAFEIIEAIMWEDNRFYYKNINTRFQREVRSQIREAFEKEQSLDGIRHVVPELRYVYVVMNLQRQSIREAKELEKFALQEKERQKRILEFQSTFSGRLQKILEEAGAKLVRWEKKGNDYLVTWITGGQTIKSIVNDSMQIISGGFCLSDYDRFHTLHSLPNLLRIYQDEGSVVITRS